MVRKIPYFDLRAETAARKLPVLIGRAEESERFMRVLRRRTASNVLVVGESGQGKTALVHGFLREISRDDSFADHALVQFDTEHLHDLEDAISAEALASLPKCVIFIDDFGRETHRNPAIVQRFLRAYRPLLLSRNAHLILALEPHEYTNLAQEFPALVRLFETITLKSQSAFEYQRILARALPRIAHARITVPDTALKETIALAERFPSLGALPRAAIRVLDEAMAHGVARGEQLLSHDSIAHVVETKTGVPKAQLAGSELQEIKELESKLSARIIDQTNAIKKIATTLQRAKLGLRSPHRPLGSFLLLGPSGVGKTETAKTVAEFMFGLPAQGMPTESLPQGKAPERLIRFDMSEFQQEHTAQRLIGAPPGYVGYGEGGALTEALKRAPHSLILLDEIEKAHPKVFDIFLQLLDDGRITSGESETIDARHCIVMATSNAAVDEIVKLPAGADDALVREMVFPALMKSFRPEFINRFDQILVFEPLSLQSLMRIAQLEVQKLEKRFESHRVRFEIEPATIERQIARLCDPRFGARPVKRFIEETCETLLAESLLAS